MKVQEPPRETLDRLPELPSDVVVPDDISGLEHPPTTKKLGGRIFKFRWLIALVVFAVAAMITALVVTGGEDTEIAQETDAAVSSILSDPGPPWEPSVVRVEPVAAVAVPEIEFGGMTAPVGHPNYGRLETYLGADDSPILFDAGPSWVPSSAGVETVAVVAVTDSEFGGLAAPTWHPNYGRLETYLGAEPTSGPR